MSGFVGETDVLFNAHRDGVFRYLSRIVGPGNAGELTQEVFLRVTRGPIPSGDEASRRAWIFAIARNLALNRVRDERRHGTVVALPDTPAPATQELAAALSEALGQLGAMDREVFLMRESAGLSYEEIARACDLTIDGVRSRLHRTRQHLREALGPSLRRSETGTGVRIYGRPTRD
jgi:RNA polymerase sigma-70 factor, ECF subfamily